MLICVVTVSVCSAQTNRGTTNARVVHFPADRSLDKLTIHENAKRNIGRCFFVEPQPSWNMFGWPSTYIGPAVGDVNVPDGKMLRLDVWDAGPRAHLTGRWGRGRGGGYSCFESGQSVWVHFLAFLQEQPLFFLKAKQPIAMVASMTMNIAMNFSMFGLYVISVPTW